MDPRVKTPAAVIAQTHATAVALFDAIARDSSRRREGRCRAQSASRGARSVERRVRWCCSRVRHGARRDCRAGGRWRRAGRWSRSRRRRARRSADLPLDYRRALNIVDVDRGGRRRSDDAGDDRRSQRSARLCLTQCALGSAANDGSCRVERQASRSRSAADFYRCPNLVVILMRA